MLSDEQETLFTRIPRVEDTQACWLLLLVCTSTRANFWLRVVSPEQSLQFAERHDAAADHCEFPTVHGGVGLTSVVRSRVAAFWSSWADCIKIKDRHPVVANMVIDGIARDPVPCFQVPEPSLVGSMPPTGLWKSNFMLHIGKSCRLRTEHS